MAFDVQVPAGDRVTAQLVLPGGREVAGRRWRAAAALTRVRLAPHRRGRTALRRSRARRIALTVRTARGLRLRAAVAVRR